MLLHNLHVCFALIDLKERFSSVCTEILCWHLSQVFLVLCTWIWRIDTLLLCINILGTFYFTCSLQVLWVTWECTVSVFLHFPCQHGFPSLLFIYLPSPWSCCITQLSFLEGVQRPIEEFNVREQVNMVSGSLKFPSTCYCLIAC